MLNLPEGCAFAPRCEKTMKICLICLPPELVVGKDHLSTCWMNVKEFSENGEIDLLPETEDGAFFTAIEDDAQSEGLAEEKKEEGTENE